MILTRVSVGTAASSRPQAPRLPPIQSSEMSPEQYYPQSATAQLNAAFAHDGKSSRPPQKNLPMQQVPGRGPVPRFQKIKTTQELHPRLNAQPAFRRANPEGGFISVCDTPPAGRLLTYILLNLFSPAFASIDNPSTCDVSDMQPCLQIRVIPEPAPSIDKAEQRRQK